MIYKYPNHDPDPKPGELFYFPPGKGNRYIGNHIYYAYCNRCKFKDLIEYKLIPILDKIKNDKN